MNKIIIGIIAIVVIGVGGVLAYNKATHTSVPLPPTSTEASTTNTTVGDTIATTFKTTGGITMVEVSKHNNATSCYSAINGNVYDLTKWINVHPGGPDKILSICGIDGSAAFNAQHGDAKRQAAILATFKIGTLAN